MSMDFIKNVKKFIRCVRKSCSPFPEEIQLEVTNRCNFKCKMCPREKMNLPEKDMSIDTLDKIIKNLIRPYRFILTGWGEPLLHPHFFEIVIKIREKFPSAKIDFTTNGILLDEKKDRENN